MFEWRGQTIPNGPWAYEPREETFNGTPGDYLCRLRRSETYALVGHIFLPPAHSLWGQNEWTIKQKLNDLQLSNPYLWEKIYTGEEEESSNSNKDKRWAVSVHMASTGEYEPARRPFPTDKPYVTFLKAKELLKKLCDALESANENKPESLFFTVLKQEASYWNLPSPNKALEHIDLMNNSDFLTALSRAFEMAGIIPKKGEEQ